MKISTNVPLERLIEVFTNTQFTDGLDWVCNQIEQEEQNKEEK